MGRNLVRRLVLGRVDLRLSRAAIASALGTLTLIPYSAFIAQARPTWGESNGVAGSSVLAQVRPSTVTATCQHSFRQTQERQVVLWSVKTTLTLLSCNGQPALAYDSHFRDRRFKGGPLKIPGNGQWLINRDPDLVVTISEFKRTSSHLSCRVKIVANKLGSHLIFDGALGGTLAHQLQNKGVEIARSLKTGG